MINNKISLFVMDVDGTLTDGGVFVGDTGEMFKRYDVKDGYGIKNILPKMGIVSAIITGRESKNLNIRCQELNINYVIQNCNEKKTALSQLVSDLSISYDEVAYIGDDLNDIEAIKLVGVSGCPQDAIAAVKKEVDYITAAFAGHGAVREFIDWIVEKETVMNDIEEYNV